MAKEFIYEEKSVPCRARSRRRRECGVTASSVSQLMPSEGTGGESSGHTHSNKELLDALSVVAGYLLAGGAKVNAGQADEATHAASAATLDDDSVVRDLFLSKTDDDTAAGVITFLQGLISAGDAVFRRDVSVGGELSVGGSAQVGSQLDVDEDITAQGTIEGDYISAVKTVHGDTVLARTLLQLGENTRWTINKLGQAVLNTLTLSGLLTGKDATFENITVTKAAHFFQLIIDELKSQQGAVIITAANCDAAEVNLIDGSDSYFYGMGWDGCYVVYYRAKDADGRAVTQTWMAGDQAICQSFNAAAGTSYNASNKYYWRLVKHASTTPRTLADGNDYHFIVLSTVTGEYDGNSVPEAGDHIVQLGYQGSDDAARKSAVILSAYNTPDTDLTPPLIATYKGINEFRLSSHRGTYVDGIGADFVGHFHVATSEGTQDLQTYVDGRAEAKASASLTVANELIRAEVARAEGAESRIEAKADGIISRVENAEGSISMLEQTAQGLNGRVTDAEGNIAELKVATDEIHIGLRGDGSAGTNLLNKPDFTQENVITEGAWDMSDTSGLFEYTFKNLEYGYGEVENVMVIDGSDVYDTSAHTCNIQQLLTKLEPDTVYTASVYVRNADYSDAGSNRIALYIQRASGLYTPVIEDVGGSGENITVSRTTATTYIQALATVRDSDWHRIWITFRTPKVMGTYRMAVRTYQDARKYGNAWELERPKLEEGARATVWSAMSDRLHEAGIDLTRSKIRLDAQTVEVAEDLTIGGHTRVGGFVYNIAKSVALTDTETGVVNPFGRSDLMNAFMQGQSVENYVTEETDEETGETIYTVAASELRRVLRFPDCGAYVVYNNTEETDLVLPFYADLKPTVNKLPYQWYTSAPWLVSAYGWLESLLKDGLGESLPYADSRMMIRCGNAGGTLNVYGVKGFGHLIHPSTYVILVREYDPWGYYMILWQVTLPINGPTGNDVTRSQVVDCVERHRRMFFTANGSSTGTTQVTNAEILPSLTCTLAVSVYGGNSTYEGQMVMDSSMYALLHCKVSDGNVWWEIEDCFTA